ncbi:GNAT family N-acetyltransferase [Kosakonia radicincitans]|uniref:GNAT family N-acetyltransferase n=1 Tax=Kosakonia radicincitans TaxID=283686 RepID=UPI0005C2C798|nr:GNAT family protein [Kosakonia radicincitans]KIS41267.1 acetyltransferase domain protein [Kosakonia radicincitans YD4]
MSQFNQYQQPIGDALPDWQPRPFPQRVTLEGRYCRLEPLGTGHASALFQAHQQAGDDRSWTWLLREPEKDEAAFRDWIASTCTLRDPLHFAVIDNKTSRPVGSLALMRIDEKNGVMEVGSVHFSPLLARTPASTEAQWLLMNYAFTTLGYRRYEWKCNSLNEPSRQAALRLGFQYEGRFRQALVLKGHNRDTDWFSIIDGEWPQIDRALQRWLAADNFTADGKQRHSLASLRA